MAHLHVIHDSDGHFKIDPIARAIKNESNSKITLQQGDHNSEEFTFEIPRFVDGHDMMECTDVEIHYINIDATNKEQQSKDFEPAKNIECVQNENGTEVMTFTWVIQGKATKYVGTLDFCIRFACLTDDIIDYQRYSGIFSGVSIGKSIYNAEHIVEENSDIIEQWKADIEKNIMQITRDYLEENGATAVAKIGEVTLLADAWTGTGNLYSQVVSIEGVTENSQVDLTPDVETLAVFYEKDVTFVTENEGGIVTVYAIGQKPQNDYTIQVTITEVEYE